MAASRRLKAQGIQTLALLEIYQRRQSPALREAICARCDAILASGSEYFRDEPHEEAVASWGYRQLQAVARAGRLLGRTDYIAACEATVRNLIEPMVAEGFYHIYPHDQDHQCAYDISPLVLGLEELYYATGAPSLRELAGRE